MSSKAQQIIDYLHKLQRIINTEADFIFLKRRIIKKRKIDDVLVCILASFPKEYKLLIDVKSAVKLRSITYYKLLMQAIKNKFILSEEYYLVYSDKAIFAINQMIKTIEGDINSLDL